MSSKNSERSDLCFSKIKDILPKRRSRLAVLSDGEEEQEEGSNI